MSTALATAPADFRVPALIERAETRTLRRFLEFFTAQISNRNTRAAYGHAVAGFLAWCDERGIRELAAIQPLHVAAYREHLLQSSSAPTVKQKLAAIRMLFDWLVLGQIFPLNPASSVRGPRHSVSKGRTPVLSAEEARHLLESIDTAHVVGLRDRALIALMIYTFARVGAVVRLRVGDYFPQKKRWWVRLAEKNGKVNEMPCHHNLETYLDEYLEVAGIAADKVSPLFRSTAGKTRTLTSKPMHRIDVYQMIRRRAKQAGIETAIGCHTFRATGITTYLTNGGKLEIAQRMAGHSNAKTTGLYDRRNDEVSLDEVERIVI
jgi:integrase/recombinase XerD